MKLQYPVIALALLLASCAGKDRMQSGRSETVLSLGKVGVDVSKAVIEGNAYPDADAVSLGVFLTASSGEVYPGAIYAYYPYALTPSKGMADRASFNVEAFSLKDGLYYAVYPSLASLSDPENIVLDLSGQVQTENNSTGHLSACDYCLASAQIKDNSGYFKFEHKVCWLKILLPAGLNNTEFSKVTFSAANGVASSLVLNAGTGAVSCSRQPGDVLTLELGTGNGIKLAPDDTLVAYMCVPAGTYSDIVITAESSASYKSVFSHSGGISFENGRYYLAVIGESDIVPLEEIEDYGIYNCDSEGRIKSWMPAVARFRRGEHQISWYSGAGITSFAFFELGTRDFASFMIDSETLTVGNEYSVDIVSGEGTVCSGAAFRLLKKEGSKAWLLDSGDNLGCIIRIDE